MNTTQILWNAAGQPGGEGNEKGFCRICGENGTIWSGRSRHTAGYQNMRDAVITLRMQGKTLKEIAAIIGCCPATVYRYTPQELRGALCGRSEYWWQVRRAQCAQMTELNRQRHAENKEHHCWNKYNRLLFKKQTTKEEMCRKKLNEK